VFVSRASGRMVARPETGRVSQAAWRIKTGKSASRLESAFVRPEQESGAMGVSEY
jgi:hypothetical protein